MGPPLGLPIKKDYLRIVRKIELCPPPFGIWEEKRTESERRPFFATSFWSSSSPVWN